MNFLSDNKADYKSLLGKIIYDTVDEYAKSNQVEDKNEQFAFYKSQVVVEELLQYSFFKESDTKEIVKAFESNPNIIKPTEKELSSFYKIFQNKTSNHPELKKLEMHEHFSTEVFNISAKVNILEKEITSKLDRLQEVPQMLTPIPPIYADEVIGREKELEQLFHLLSGTQKPVQVIGVGGMGKTTIVKSYVEANQDRYDHIAWIDGSGSLRSGLVKDISLLNNLGLKKAEGMQEKDLSDMILNGLRNLKGENLLVIDDAVSGIEQEHDLFPSGKGWKVLLTSRQRFDRLEIFSPGTFEHKECKGFIHEIL